MIEDDLKFAWLAGLIDGQGTLVLAVQTTRSGTRSITARVAVYPQGRYTSEVIREVMALAGVRAAKSLTVERGGQYRDQFEVRVQRYKDIQALCLACAPYSVTKATQWELMAEFVTSRLARLNSPNTPEEWHALEEMQKRNIKGKPSYV